MLAGRPPFRGAGFADVAARHVRDEPPPIGARRPGLPPGLSALLAALLAKSPDEAAGRRHGAHRPALDPHAARRRRARARSSPRRCATTDDAEPPTGEYAGSTRPTRRPRRAGAVGGRHAVSMNFEHGGPIHLETTPYRVPASARENAGPLRWVAVLALGVAVGIAAAARADRGSGGGTPRAAAHDTAPGPRRRRRRPGTRHATTATEPRRHGRSRCRRRSRSTRRPATAPRTTTRRRTPSTATPPPSGRPRTIRSDPVLSKGGVGLVLALPARAKVSASSCDAGPRLHGRALHVPAARTARHAGRLGRRRPPRE